MARLLIPALLASLSLAACASAPPQGVPRASALPSGLPLGCVPNSRTQRCDQFGAYYSGDDLRRTGAQHVGQALTLLDPQLGH